MTVEILEFPNKFIVKTEFGSTEIEKISDQISKFDPENFELFENVIKNLIPKKYIVRFDEQSGKIAP